MNEEIYFPTPPDAIFKYFGPERSGIFRNLRIRFANPATFNDPFEASPRFDSWAEKKVKETAEKLVIFNAQFGITADKTSKFIEDYRRQSLPELVKRHSENFQKECGERFRMLCFCESVQNPLMWGHYCDSQKGFALQFDTKHLFFKDRLAKVQYDKKRPEIDDPHSGVRIPLTKNDEWKYENEWRMVQEVSSAEPYYETLPVECIKAVYFGLRISPIVRWEIESALQSQGRAHIQKFEMTLDFTEYKLIPIPIQNSPASADWWIAEGI